MTLKLDHDKKPLNRQFTGEPSITKIPKMCILVVWWSNVDPSESIQFYAKNQPTYVHKYKFVYNFLTAQMLS